MTPTPRLTGTSDAKSPTRPSKFRQRLAALVGFGIAVAGGIVLLLHVVEAAFTQHMWFLVGQGMVIGGGLAGLTQVWGGLRRSRR